MERVDLLQLFKRSKGYSIVSVQSISFIPLQTGIQALCHPPSSLKEGPNDDQTRSRSSCTSLKSSLSRLSVPDDELTSYHKLINYKSKII